MQIKVFKAPTMKEAMEQVKNELGVDAVILHTKKYKEGGFFGYGSKEIVEVTAAVEEEKKETKKPAAKKMAKPAKVNPVLPNTVLSQYKTNGTEAGVEKAAKDFMPVQQTAPVVQKPEFPAFGTNPLEAASPGSTVMENQELSSGLEFYEPEKPEKKEKTKKPRILKVGAFEDSTGAKAKSYPEAAMEPQAQTDREEGTEYAEQEKIQKLESELAQMKTLLAQVMSKDQPQNLLTLQEVLHRQGLSEDMLDEMAAQSGAGETLADASSDEARETLKNYLQHAMNFSEGITLSKRGPRIAALIGPTGVGKTTTLAKIAARFVLEQGVSAALITADTYRISAVEQLKTYSDIIGLPLEIVYSADELRVAIRKHEDKQLILIDTAGRSQHNARQMSELQGLLKANSKIEKHLVISATTKDQDVLDIVEKFSVCNPEHVIFTKVDETSSLGIIPNLLHGRDMSLSYLAHGQSVPDDIEPADAEKLAELLLRE